MQCASLCYSVFIISIVIICILSRKRKYQQLKEINKRHFIVIIWSNVGFSVLPLSLFLCILLWVYTRISCYSVFSVCVISCHFVLSCPLRHYTHIGFLFFSFVLCLTPFVSHHLCGLLLLSMTLCLWTVLSPSLYISTFTFFPFLFFPLFLCSYPLILILCI